MDLPLVALRSLLEVQRRGTMAAAASALGYTPGAISQHIAALARAAGRPVVVQAGRTVRLTDAGLVLAEHARRVLDSQAEAERALEADAAPVAGTVRVGTFATGTLLLATAFARLKESAPELTLRVHELRETTTDNALLAVVRGEVDLALTLDYPDAPTERSAEVEYTPLLTEPFGVCGLPPAPDDGDPAEDMDEADPARGAVSLSELAHLDWVIPPPDSSYGAAIRAACRHAGFEPRATHLVTDTAASLRLAAAGLGLTLATGLMAAFARPESLSWRPLVEVVERQVLVLHRRDAAERPAVLAVIDALQSH